MSYFSAESMKSPVPTFLLYHLEDRLVYQQGCGIFLPVSSSLLANLLVVMVKTVIRRNGGSRELELRPAKGVGFYQSSAGLPYSDALSLCLGRT